MVVNAKRTVRSGWIAGLRRSHSERRGRAESGHSASGRLIWTIRTGWGARPGLSSFGSAFRIEVREMALSHVVADKVEAACPGAMCSLSGASLPRRRRSSVRLRYRAADRAIPRKVVEIGP